MKSPNFRLYDTQAVFSALLGVVAVLFVILLAFVVARNFDPHAKVIWFNPKQKIREPIIFAASGGAALCGVISAIMGFNSLGQKRNNRQGMSWLGLALGALSLVLAVIGLVAWQKLKLSSIM
jgi:hypothetical protein